MKKIQTTKLQLRTETIKTLDSKQLYTVVGGANPPTISLCKDASCRCP